LAKRNDSSVIRFDIRRHTSRRRDARLRSQTAQGSSRRRSDFDVLPFGRLWYDTSDNAVGHAMHNSRSHGAVIRVYDAAGNVIATHEHAGDFVEP